MKFHNILLCALLIVIGATQPTVHAAPVLTIFPATVATDPNNAASYIITLNGGTANASYALTITGLPTGSAYSFSSTTIKPGDSSVLTIQTSIGTPLYCPKSYPFTVTVTNTILSSDTASATGSLGVNQVGPDLAVSLSSDKSAYMVGESVTISIVTNRPAEWTLTITPPAGPSQRYQFGYTSPPTKTLAATLPAGTWAATVSADDYCGGSYNAVAHFDVISPTVSSTNTTTITTTTIATTLAVTSTSSSTTSTSTSATSLLTATSITTETGNATLISAMTTTTTTQWTSSIHTTLSQSATTSTIVISNIQNLPLELILVSVFTISFLVIVISIVRRPWFGGAITCRNCSFKNPSTASSFCIKCGQPLKRG